MKIYNFAAGPSTLFEEVKQEAQRDLLNYKGSGMSVMEMSHRGKWYEDIHNEAIALLRELMQIGDDYYVLLLQGGASTQFDAVPLNLLKKGKADYIVTGNFANKAFKVAQKYGDIACIATSKETNYSYIPDVEKVPYRDNIDYVHITTNNTVFGSQYNKLPNVETLVADMSSNILGKWYDINKFGLVYAGAQKNIGPAGLTVVIVRKDLVGNAMPYCPVMLDYKSHASSNSLFNTPPCFAIYMAMLNLRQVKKRGGIKAMEETNIYKSNLLYDIIDNSEIYHNNIEKSCRSIMNVSFITRSPEMDAKFVKVAQDAGLVTLKGHKSAGGIRASIYNGMEIEGVKALAEFMKKFELENK
ncbi:MAG: 3-phosphoserine/phosphohydroxythreonine transaminase [Clostridiales bacterium]|nr:3-phosphoserine/phosphohydroxythreonine transaminase [Clostridiales bacterium]